MYEELVERLRAQAEAERYCGGEKMLYEIAADAIEELRKRPECPCWYGDIRFCSMLGKPLPEPPKEET